MKPWAYELTGTIFELNKKAKETGFLDPWTSILPDFLKEKMEPDVLAIFDKNANRIENQSDLHKIKSPFWVLVFPKRSYVPVEYPHLQLWFLGEDFSPSLYFLDGQQKDNVVKIVKEVRASIECFSRQSKLSSSPVIAYNATPFSFVKNDKGQYVGGGQSVRTFHFHLFAVPENLKKINLSRDQIPVVYPTKFALEFFRLIFRNKQIQRSLFGIEDFDYKTNNLGIEFEFGENLRDLVEVLSEIDKLFYRLQMILIQAFYKDSKNFLEKINTLIFSGRSKSGKEEMVLFGKERALLEIKKNFKIETMRKLLDEYQVRINEDELNDVANLLRLDANGDLASTVDDQVVVLRPGLGYGCFIKVKDKNYHVHIAPLDTINSKGVMESAGHFTTGRTTISEKPVWEEKIAKFLKEKRVC